MLPANKNCDGVGWDGMAKPAGAGEVASGDSQHQPGQGLRVRDAVLVHLHPSPKWRGGRSWPEGKMRVLPSSCPACLAA